MEILNKPIFAIATLLGFIWLAWYSQQQTGYTHSVFTVMDKYRTKDAKILQELFNVSDEEVAKPVVLWPN